MIDIVRGLARDIGEGNWRVWLGHWVHSYLEVDRWKYQVHWASITRSLASAVIEWSQTGDLTVAAVHLRKAATIYDKWCVDAGKPKVSMLADLDRLMWSLAAEWVRQRATQRMDDRVRAVGSGEATDGRDDPSGPVGGKAA